VIWRLATLPDLDAASIVVRTTFIANVAPLYNPEGVQTFLSYAQADAWGLRHSQGHKTWIALEGERIVGVAHVRDGNHLSMLFVLPAHQRAGVGRALLDVLRRENPNSELTVNSSPNAVPAYQKYGFEATGPEIVTSGILFVPMRLPAPNKPNQLPDPTSLSVTPPAGAGSAPSVAADH
jgi:GNAT superfamily N-acetyltransferase